jgi:hypothetical protein
VTAWIFQGNPKLYNVNDYLKRCQIIQWPVKQRYFAKDIAMGDVVYLWRSDGDKPKSGGIVAKGKVISPPVEVIADGSDTANEDSLPAGIWVDIEIEAYRLTDADGMLNRMELVADPCLYTMLIFRVRRQTNYRLEPQHADRIATLWQQSERRRHP